MKIRIHPFIKVAFKLVLSIAALSIVFIKVKPGDIIDLLQPSSFAGIILALLFFIGSKVISSHRLNLFFNANGINVPFKYNLKLYWLGMYYNLFLPGGIGGDGYKIFYISKSVGTKKIIAFQSIVLDRLFGVATIIILASILLIIIQPFKNSVLIGILSSFVVFAIGFLILKIFFGNFVHIMCRAFLFSVIIQLNQLVSAYCILRAVGVETHIMENLLLFLISSIVTIIPVTLGGMGAREITFLIGSEYLFIDLTPAIGLALIFFIITFITSLWGMVYSYTGIPLTRESSS